MLILISILFYKNRHILNFTKLEEFIIIIFLIKSFFLQKCSLDKLRKDLNP